MRTCKKCNTEKTEDLFVKDKKSKDGLRNICIECNKSIRKILREKNKDKISERNKKWNKENKEYFVKYCEENNEKLKEYKNKYKELNSEKILEYTKKYKSSEIGKSKQKGYSKNYRLNNKEKLNAYSREYYEKNKLRKKETEKERLRNYMRERKQNDPLFKMKCNLRTTLYISLKKIGYKKDSNTESIIGCSYEELMEHIERQFQTWMTWNNHGLYEIDKYNIGWDIDHIIPLNTAKTPEEVLSLFHYTNLQPLCSKINRDIKKGKH